MSACRSDFHGFSQNFHSTYIRQADICNYDGKNKHQTEIADEVFIGSNSCLVAPVTIGKGAYIGAGSTVTKDVPPGALGIGRSRQTNLEGWSERKKDKSK